MAKAELKKLKGGEPEAEKISSRLAGNAPRQFMAGRAIGLLAATAMLFGAIGLVSNTFLSPYTMFVLSRQVAFSILIALSQAVCLVVGGMNLSVGAIGSMTTVILGLCFQNLGFNSWLAVPVSFLL